MAIPAIRCYHTHWDFGLPIHKIIFFKPGPVKLQKTENDFSKIQARFNNRIKSTEIENSDVADELAKMVFDKSIGHKKIRYPETEQDIPFSRKLDDRLNGREYELSINVISPFHENADNFELLKMHAMGKGELLLIMPQDARLVTDLLMYKRTDKYIRQNITVTQEETKKRILGDKQHSNHQRQALIQKKVDQLLGKAKLIVSGVEVEIAGTDPQHRVVQGFFALVQASYPNLKMLKGCSFREEDVPKYINGSSATLFPDEDTNLSEAEQDMLAFIRLNNKNSMRTTVKMIVDKYEKRPYGWYFAAIVTILAKLYARDKVTFRSDSDLLEEKALEKGLLNTQAHFNITLEPQIDFPASQLRASKDFIKDFFDEQPAATEAKALGKEMHNYFKHLADELRSFMTHHTHFPFLTRLEPLAEEVSGFLKKPHTFFLKEFNNHKEELLDIKESLLDPLRNFMNGATREEYQEIKKFSEISKLNLQELRDDHYSELLTLLESKDCFKGQCIKRMKALYRGLKEAVDSALQKEKGNALQAVRRIKEQIIKEAEYTALTPEKQKRVNDRLVEIENDILNLDLIAAIRDKRHRFEQDGVTDLYNQMATWGQKEKQDGKAGEWQVSDTPPQPLVEYVSLQTLKVNFSKSVLTNDEDIDAYLKKLKDLLQAAIKDSKKIKI